MTRQIMRQPMLLCLTAGLLTIAPAARAASLVYDFEQEGTGTKLAQLDLSMLPATHEEVVSLTFTPAGQEFFGYDFARYPGTFAQSCLPFLDDGMGGLTGEGYCFTDPSYMQSNDPPQSSLTSLQTSSFIMTANVTGDEFDDGDTLRLYWLLDDPEDEDPHNLPVSSVEAIGDWRIVPEPSGLSLVCWPALVAVRLFARRRHKRES